MGYAARRTRARVCRLDCRVQRGERLSVIRSNALLGRIEYRLRRRMAERHADYP